MCGEVIYGVFSNSFHCFGVSWFSNAHQIVANLDIIPGFFFFRDYEELKHKNDL